MKKLTIADLRIKLAEIEAGVAMLDAESRRLEERRKASLADLEKFKKNMKAFEEKYERLSKR